MTRSVEIGLVGFHFVDPAVCGTLIKGRVATTQCQPLYSLPETLTLASSGAFTADSG